MADELESNTPRRSLSRFVGAIGRFVHLAEDQGTRLVDVLERWVHAAEEHNRQTARAASAHERLADAAERLAHHADSYLGGYEE